MTEKRSTSGSQSSPGGEAPAIERAYKAWRDAGSLRSFEADLWAHMHTGIVVSCPALFAMARAVEFRAGENAMRDFARNFDTPDTWLVWSAAGNLLALLELMPYDLPYLAFHRGSERRRGPQPLRSYPTARVRTLAQALANAEAPQ